MVSKLRGWHNDSSLEQPASTRRCQQQEVIGAISSICLLCVEGNDELWEVGRISWVGYGVEPVQLQISDRKKYYGVKGSSPNINQGNADALAQMNRESPSPQSYKTARDNWIWRVLWFGQLEEMWIALRQPAFVVEETHSSLSQRISCTFVDVHDGCYGAL
eukprot:scaffold64113_cov18-Tisochrysis_lutea.AAC.1